MLQLVGPKNVFIFALLIKYKIQEKEKVMLVCKSITLINAITIHNS